MKQNEMKSEIERIDWLCEYRLSGLEREALLLKRDELYRAMAHVREVGAALKEMLKRYE